MDSNEILSLVLIAVVAIFLFVVYLKFSRRIAKDESKGIKQRFFKKKKDNHDLVD